VLSNSEQAQRLPADWEDFYPMSHIEQGMIFLNQLKPGAGVYHDQFTFQLVDPQFDFDTFVSAFTQLTRKHPALRTSLHVGVFHEPLQVLHRSPRVDIELHEYPSSDPMQQQMHLAAFMARDRERAFDVTKPGLWRIRVFRQSADTYSLLWVFHHAILDGWSNASLMTELANTYFQLKANPDHKLNPLVELANSSRTKSVGRTRRRPITGARYSAGIKTRDSRSRFNATPKMRRPHASARCRIDADLAQSLNRLARDEQTATKHIFLAAFAELMCLTTGKTDVLFGLVTNTRPEAPMRTPCLAAF
jgi:surfactin family lipopeptide synthetase A